MIALFLSQDIGCSDGSRVNVSYSNGDNSTSTVICDGDWFIVLRRQHTQSNFIKTVEEYKTGFTYQSGDHWIGLNSVHYLTAKRKYILRLEFWDTSDDYLYEEYRNFVIGDEISGYLMKIGEVLTSSGKFSFMYNGSRFVAHGNRSADACAIEGLSNWWRSNDEAHCAGPASVRDLRKPLFPEGMHWYNSDGKIVPVKKAVMKMLPGWRQNEGRMHISSPILSVQLQVSYINILIKTILE